jgi:aquaporin Z
MLPVNYLVEFIGTFVFLYIILESSNYASYQPFAIVIGLLAAILMFGAISGGHFNPAVTTMLWAKGSPDLEPIGYIAAQVLGGLAAWKAHNYITANAKLIM